MSPTSLGKGDVILLDSGTDNQRVFRVLQVNRFWRKSKCGPGLVCVAGAVWLADFLIGSELPMARPVRSLHGLCRRAVKIA